MHKCAEYLENLKRDTSKIHVYILLCLNIRKEEQKKKLLTLALLLILAQPVQAYYNTLEHPQFIQEQGVLINPYQVTLIKKQRL